MELEEAIKKFLSLTFNDYYTIWFSDDCQIYTCVIEDHQDKKLPLKIISLMKLARQFDFEQKYEIIVANNELTCIDAQDRQIVLTPYDNEIYHLNLIKGEKYGRYY